VLGDYFVVTSQLVTGGATKVQGTPVLGLHELLFLNKDTFRMLEHRLAYKFYGYIYHARAEPNWFLGSFLHPALIISGRETGGLYFLCGIRTCFASQYFQRPQLILTP
jgi:hypothetical protein